MGRRRLKGSGTNRGLAFGKASAEGKRLRGEAEGNPPAGGKGREMKRRQGGGREAVRWENEAVKSVLETGGERESKGRRCRRRKDVGRPQAVRWVGNHGFPGVSRQES